MKPEIEIQDLEKIDIRVGTITNCEEIDGSDKLLKLTVDFGASVGVRTVLTGMKKWYKPEEMLNLQTTFVLNLKPRRMMGMISEGMIFAASNTEGKPTFLVAKTVIENGAELI